MSPEHRPAPAGPDDVAAFGWNVSVTDDGWVRLRFDTPRGPFITDLRRRDALDLSNGISQTAAAALAIELSPGNVTAAGPIPARADTPGP